MKKRSIGLIIGLMGFALLGVVAMQLYFLRQSYQMQSELFSRSVNEALNNVVTKVAKQDAINFLNIKSQKKRASVPTPAGAADKNIEISINGNKSNTFDSVKFKRNQSKRQRKLAILRDSLKRMIMQKKIEDDFAGMVQQGNVDVRIRIEEFTDEFGDVHGRILPEVVKSAPRLFIKKKLNKYDTLRYIYVDPQFGRQAISVP